MKNFPMQQGYLDDLCSLYAVINLRHLCGTLCDIKAAGTLFAKLVSEIANAKGGNLSSALTRGISPANGDIEWLTEKAGLTDMSRKRAPDAAWLEHALQEECPGVLVFLRLSDGVTHYTILTRVIDRDRIVLFDSYGYTTLKIAETMDDITDSSAFIAYAWTVVRPK